VARAYHFGKADFELLVDGKLDGIKGNVSEEERTVALSRQTTEEGTACFREHPMESQRPATTTTMPLLRVFGLQCWGKQCREASGSVFQEGG